MKSVINLILEDLHAHPEGLLGQGFWALAVHRIGHSRFNYNTKLIRWPLGVFHTISGKLVEIFCGILIGHRAVIGSKVVIWHSGAIVIHGSAVIGDRCVLRQGVTIGNKSDSDPLGAPNLGTNVNVGAGAKLLGRIHIGNDAVIGANAVVLHDVPASHLAVGVPARTSPRRVISTPNHE